MSTGSVCWVPDDASRTSRQGAAREHVAGYAPAQRQGSALHPCRIPCTPCRGSNGLKAVIGRAEARSKFHWQWSRARSGGAPAIFGAMLPDYGPLRGYRRFTMWATQLRLCWRLICLRCRHVGAVTSWVGGSSKSLFPQLLKHLPLPCPRHFFQTVKQQLVDCLR